MTCRLLLRKTRSQGRREGVLVSVILDKEKKKLLLFTGVLTLGFFGFDFKDEYPRLEVYSK